MNIALYASSDCHNPLAINECTEEEAQEVVLAVQQTLKAHLLTRPLTDMPWSVRALNTFHREKLTTFLDLLSLSPEKVKKLRSFGRVTAREVMATCLSLGLEARAFAEAYKLKWVA